MNCQIVLCREYNDKEELDRTIKDLGALYPYVQSLSVVPVGLSAHREGLVQLKAFDRESSKQTIEQVSKWQRKFKKKHGVGFVYLSDEFYINAGEKIPNAEEYDGFPQIENGVGLVAAMEEEFENGFEMLETKTKKRVVSIATGELVYEFIKGLCNQLCEKIEGLKINVYPIKNEFFGGGVNVSGLVVGRDIIHQIKDKELGETLFIPDTMLRSGEEVFLDDTTLSNLSETLGVGVVPVSSDGYEFIEKITGEELIF